MVLQHANDLDLGGHITDRNNRPRAAVVSAHAAMISPSPEVPQTVLQHADNEIACKSVGGGKCLPSRAVVSGHAPAVGPKPEVLSAILKHASGNKWG